MRRREHDLHGCAEQAVRLSRERLVQVRIFSVRGGQVRHVILTNSVPSDTSAMTTLAVEINNLPSCHDLDRPDH
jgi:hypothetical protein